MCNSMWIIQPNTQPNIWLDGQSWHFGSSSHVPIFSGYSVSSSMNIYENSTFYTQYSSATCIAAVASRPLWPELPKFIQKLHCTIAGIFAIWQHRLWNFKGRGKKLPRFFGKKSTYSNFKGNYWILQIGGGVKKCQNLTFKVNFLCQNLSESFWLFFHWIYEHIFCYWHFLDQSFNHFIF